ncbi:hypothetical protein AMATHDRAFT_76095 [Amanita thiersii Skay4041]|uniref:BD-FAE-like domain-containing protein n=1 Tax=Amanita thiersii Skay4041 TaxID=703135 RepID=A0A2A9NPG9_9AGAR|nr:hypothetical protein AMATHDRAFT_76095 [Amanita thiersii Skay4041]
METVASIEDPTISNVLVPTFQAFAPLLEKKREDFLGANKVTLQYGRTPRHMMDIYYPEIMCIKHGDEAPVLFFFYGGGFTTGDRNLTAPYDLVYSNIGWFFSQRGFVTIIADYRLVPEVQFPAPADDVYQAVSWAIENKEQIQDAGDMPYDLNFDSVFLIGHSAGAVHLATALLMPGLLCVDPETRDRIAGAILISGAYSFRGLEVGSPLEEVVGQYWGSFEAAQTNSIQALLESAPSDIISVLPEVLMVEGDREPHWLVMSGGDFQQRLSERTTKPEAFNEIPPTPDDGPLPRVTIGSVTRLVAKGHNHISLHLSLGSGEGEQWGEMVLKWMRSVLNKREIYALALAAQGLESESE